MSKPVVTVLTGLPGSGKSTYAKSLSIQTGALRIGLDDIRIMMGWTGPASWDKSKESVAIETMMSAVEAAVEAGKDVVVDNTHLTARLPGILRRRVGGRAVFKVHSLLDVPLEECIKRDADRPRPVGEKAIRKMAKASSKWRLTDEYLNIWPEIEPVGPWVMGKPECIIVDLDGTLAIHSSRGPYEAERCDEDTVDNAVEAILFGYALTMSMAGWPYKVVFLSGREGTESIRTKTLKWLRDNLALKDDYPDTGIDYELYMREEGDMRPDFVVKYELYNNHIRGKMNPLFALDDRDQVVRLWREMGIRTPQVGYGNF
jgi:predicted kinase